MHDGDFVTSDSIVNNVRIAAEPQGMHAEVGDGSVPNRRVAKVGNPPFNAPSPPGPRAGCVH
jgi:hypothetical protein